MHDEIITDRQREGLEVLGQAGLLSRFYLVGGTAAALHLGHRLSVDFDFFGEESFDPAEIVTLIRGRLPLEIRRQSASTLHAELNEVAVTFLQYPYPLLEPLVDGPCGVRLVQENDLLAMKLIGVSQRGARKDFIDLYFLCRSGMTLEHGLGLLPRKYPGVKFETYHIINSLMYFVDAEKQDLPVMLVPFDWEECTAYFRETVPPLSRRLLGRE